jgi:hypothetical protein
LSDTPIADEPTTPQGYTAKDLSQSPTLQQHLLIGLYASLSTMVSTVTNFGDKVTELTLAVKTVHEEVRIVDDRRKRDRIVFGFMVVVLLLVVLGLGIIASGNRDQLEILRQATGPDAQAAQAANTAHIVLEIDCNGEENNRQLLVAVEGITHVPAPATREECKQFLDTPGGTPGG